MKSSIYISHKKVEVIGYTKSGKKVTIKQYASGLLPEGTMINGKIIERGYLVECLHSICGKNPKLFTDSTLIVDGSSIFAKKMTLPKLSKWRCEQHIREDFADTNDSIEELVCDYYQLEPKNKTDNTILAFAADKVQIDGYVSACRSAGIKLNSIRVGVQAILNYMDTRLDLKRTTVVLNVIDGVMMLSMLFEKGVNVFMSRTRLYGDDYEQYIQSMLQNLSGLIQFNRSQNFNEIMYSYYLGLAKNDLTLMNEINPYPGITLEALNIFGSVVGVDKLPPELSFVFLNTLLEKDSIDLIQSCKKLQKLKKRQRPKKYWIPVLICLLALLAAPVAYLYYQMFEVSAQLDDVKAYVTGEAVVSKSNELDQIMAETSYYTGIVNQINGKIEWDESMVPVSATLLDLVTKTYSDKVTILQLDFNSDAGSLRVNGSSASEIDSAAYVDALKRSRLVDGVKYTGYNYDSEGKYNFSIDIALETGEDAE